VENLSEDSEVSISELGLDNDILETDSEHSRYKEYCRVEYGALLDLRFRS